MAAAEKLGGAARHGTAGQVSQHVNRQVARGLHTQLRGMSFAQDLAGRGGPDTDDSGGETLYAAAVASPGRNSEPPILSLISDTADAEAAASTSPHTGLRCSSYGPCTSDGEAGAPIHSRRGQEAPAPSFEHELGLTVDDARSVQVAIAKSPMVAAMCEFELPQQTLPSPHDSEAAAGSILSSQRFGDVDARMRRDRGGHAVNDSGFAGCCGRKARVHLLESEGRGLGIPVIGEDGRCPDFHLRISDGKYVGSIYRIPCIDEVPSIGRSRRNAICLLADDQVSRFQAYLDSTLDGYVCLRDGGRESGSRSSNGTFVNSNCTRIEPGGHRLFYGDIIAVGATEMVVERGAASKTICTSPPLQIHGSNSGWIRADTDNPWKRQMERGLTSTQVHTCISLGRMLAVLMGCHARLGKASVLSTVTDDHLIYLILSHCSIIITRTPAPPLPATDKLGRTELPVDLRTALFGKGTLTAEQFLNSSSAPFPGRCGGVGPRACVAFKVTRVR